MCEKVLIPVNSQISIVSSLKSIDIMQSFKLNQEKVKFQIGKSNIGKMSLSGGNILH